MEAISTIVALVTLVFGVLEIILFFKLWRMCNTVEKMGSALTQLYNLFKKNNVDSDTESSVSNPESEESKIEDELVIQSRIIGKWAHPNGSIIRILKEDESDKFSLTGLDPNKKVSIRLIEGKTDNNGRGALFVDITDSATEYKISRMGFLPSLKVFRNGKEIAKYEALS